MFTRILSTLTRNLPAREVSAHCDGPCGVYDPASARIAAESVVSMTKKLLDMGDPGDVQGHNTFSRYVAIKEEQAQITKDELLILWTDYFKPQHLEQYPDLHTKFWDATKLCSATKTSIDQGKADQLMDAVKEIHNIFWSTKGRDVQWYTAS